MPRIFPLRALVAVLLIAPFVVAMPASAQTTTAGILSIKTARHQIQLVGADHLVHRYSVSSWPARPFRFAAAPAAEAENGKEVTVVLIEQAHASQGRSARTGEQGAHVRPQRRFQPQGDMT